MLTNEFERILVSRTSPYHCVWSVSYSFIHRKDIRLNGSQTSSSRVLKSYAVIQRQIQQTDDCAHQTKNVTHCSHIYSILKPDHLPGQPKPSLILLFLPLQPYSAPRNSPSAPWAPDERLREMAVILVISALGRNRYICEPASFYTRQSLGAPFSPGPRMGRLDLSSLPGHTSIKSSILPPNPPVSRYIESLVCTLSLSSLNLSLFTLMYLYVSVSCAVT